MILYCILNYINLYEQKEKFKHISNFIKAMCIDGFITTNNPYRQIFISIATYFIFFIALRDIQFRHSTTRISQCGDFWRRAKTVLIHKNEIAFKNIIFFTYAFINTLQNIALSAHYIYPLMRLHPYSYYYQQFSRSAPGPLSILFRVDSTFSE